MPANPAAGRLAVYTGVVVYLLGQAFDTYWHSRHVSFVPEPPRSLLMIHSGIYLGAAIVVVAGMHHLVRRRARAGGALLLVGGLFQLTGFFLDMWAHGHGYAKDLYHDLVWYGFALVVLGTVALEMAHRRNRAPAQSDGRPEVDRDRTTRHALNGRKR